MAEEMNTPIKSGGVTFAPYHTPEDVVQIDATVARLTRERELFGSTFRFKDTDVDNEVEGPVEGYDNELVAQIIPAGSTVRMDYVWAHGPSQNSFTGIPNDYEMTTTKEMSGAIVALLMFKHYSKYCSFLGLEPRDCFWFHEADLKEDGTYELDWST